MSVFRRSMSGALSIALLSCALLGCGGSPATDAAAPAESGSSAVEPEETHLANPFVDCESASEAAQLAGFEVTFPESVPGYSQRSYQAVEGELIQAIYREGDEEVLIRKGRGPGDISGDSTEYADVEVVALDDIEVTVKGADCFVHVALWEREGFSYAIVSNEGLETEVVMQLVASTR